MIADVKQYIVSVGGETSMGQVASRFPKLPGLVGALCGCFELLTQSNSVKSSSHKSQPAAHALVALWGKLNAIEEYVVCNNIVGAATSSANSTIDALAVDYMIEIATGLEDYMMRYITTPIRWTPFFAELKDSLRAIQSRVEPLSVDKLEAFAAM